MDTRYWIPDTGYSKEESRIENLRSRILTILPTISKPTRYLGDELNAVRKDSSNPDQIRVALAFPDIYEVGMSHLGLKILYHILNSRDDVWAERVYAPWVDMEKKMRAESIPLFSLESASPLKDFDIVGFSLQYEMSYTNVLNMLELAQIPLFTADRDSLCSSYPLIIAGGPCAFNPEPMADFIDLFVIGDGEEVITEIVDCYKSHRDKEVTGDSSRGIPAYAGSHPSPVSKDKKQLLSKMANIEGVYVPSFATVEEQPDGTLTVSRYPMLDTGFSMLDSRCSILPSSTQNPVSSIQNPVSRIRKRIVKDLDCVPYPVDYLVPFMRPIHDRAIIEIMRGCSRGCRFCQAGMIYRPVRERSLAVVERLAEELIEKTGYEEVSLSSLSTCDHSSIRGILQRLVESPGTKKHVSISLPSLRTDSFSVELAQNLRSTGKTGLTFAPEVATQRMQRVINKVIPRSEVLSTVESAFSNGWDLLKLYFMIGLPTETEEDIVEIAHLIKEVLHLALRVNTRASLNVSVSTFIPKAHTPFQWERQLSLDETKQKQKLLMDTIGRNRRVSVSFHSPQVSYLEGVFARGDRRLGEVLRVARALGCKLDGWSEHFNFDAWMQAFAQCQIDPNVYREARKCDQVMPWDHIDTYVTKDFLLAERDRACKSQLTPDCRENCAGCGVCDEKAGREMKLAPLDTGHRHLSRITHHASPITKIRFQFAKRKEVRFISHLDLLNTLTRAFRRAEVPIAYSQGFNPHPKIGFGSVLPVGTTSKAEFADIALEAYIKPDDFVSRSNDQLPPGLELLRAQEIPLKARPLMAQINLASYIVRVPLMDNQCRAKAEAVLPARIRSIMDMDHIWIERIRKTQKKHAKRRSKTGNFVDIKPFMRSIKLKPPKSLKPFDDLNAKGLADETLEFEMILGDSKDGKVRPEEVIRLIFSMLGTGFSMLDEPESGIQNLASSIQNLASSIQHPVSSIQHPASSIEIQKTGSFIEDQGRLVSPMDIINQ